MLSDSSLRPIFSTFAEAGVGEALARGILLISTYTQQLKRAKTPLPSLPWWLTHLNFFDVVHAVGNDMATMQRLSSLAYEFRAVERTLRSMVSPNAMFSESLERPTETSAEPVGDGIGEGSDDSDNDMHDMYNYRYNASTSMTTPEERAAARAEAKAREGSSSQLRAAIALVRLTFAAALEAAFAVRSTSVCLPGQSRGSISKAVEAAAARIYNDAFLVTVYTSTHANYVSFLQSGMREPPPPELSTVPNSAFEFDFSDLFARRTCVRQVPKRCLPLLSILTRSTNPGSRGWNSLLDSSLAESQATRIVVMQAVVTALAGFTPFVHPALRPTWFTRMRTLRVAQHLLTDASARATLVAIAGPTKEAVRRLLASTMATVAATQAAYAKTTHPVGHLTSPPAALPPVGMEQSMSAFLSAGFALQRVSAEEAFEPGFFHKTVSRVFAKQATIKSESCSPELLSIGWDASWLGKGSAVHQNVPLVSLASELWATTFRANFLPFWAFAMSNGTRLSRLNAVQHRALHSLNSCTAWVQKLDEKSTLDAQRAALRNPSSGILKLNEAASEIGVSFRKGVVATAANGGTKNAADTLQVLRSAGDENAARLLAYARVAWVNEQLLIVDLGARTRGMQIRALFKRLGHADWLPPESTPFESIDPALVDRLPLQTTHIQVCCECCRIGNAHSNDGGKAAAVASSSTVRFNELGVSSAMMAVKFEGEALETVCRHIRCAKRSSAALRGAIAFDALTSKRKFEIEPVDIDKIASLLGQDENESGVAARVRRDSKNSLEQRTQVLACGERPMLRVFCIGRAVRVCDAWYALCSLCGALLRVYPHNRVGSEICCLACDESMVGVEAATVARLQRVCCRFCGRCDTAGENSRWRRIKSPHDVAGRNASLPVRLSFFASIFRSHKQKNSHPH